MGVVVNARFPRRRRWLIVVRNTFRHLFVGAYRSWLRNLAANAPALGSMTLLLVLSGLVGLGAYMMQSLAATQARDAAVLHVYLRDDAKSEDVQALRERLSDDRLVASVVYTSKADALRRAQSRPGLPDLAAASDSNPFPASLDVSLSSLDNVDDVARAVDSSPAVDPVLRTSFDRSAQERIQKAVTIVGIAGGLFVLLLGFVAVAVTANSIRGAILTRQQEVQIMQLVGAPRWLVRGPFVVEGALTGGIAGGIAALVTLIFGLTGMAVGAGTFTRFAPGVTFGVCLVAALLIFLAGVVLGAAASFLSVRRQLRPGL